MSLTGPFGVPKNITNDVTGAGVIEGTGNDSFSADFFLKEGRNGDTYTCAASNIVSHSSKIFILQGIEFMFCKLMPLIGVFQTTSSHSTVFEADISHISESGVESAIRRSHSDWLCSTLQ